VLELGGLFEVDENQMRKLVIAAGIDDSGPADTVAIRPGKFGTFVNVPVQSHQGLDPLDPIAHCLAPDVASIVSDM
jgi:hypothetical protein